MASRVYTLTKCDEHSTSFTVCADLVAVKTISSISIVHLYLYYVSGIEYGDKSRLQLLCNSSLMVLSLLKHTCSVSSICTTYQLFHQPHCLYATCTKALFSISLSQVYVCEQLVPNIKVHVCTYTHAHKHLTPNTIYCTTSRLNILLSNTAIEKPLLTRTFS